MINNKNFNNYLIIPAFQQTVFLMKRSWSRLEDVFVLVLRRRLQDAFKTSWWRRKYSPNSYVFRRRLQDIFKKSWWRPNNRLGHMSSRRFQDVLKMSLRRLQDVLQKRLQNIFKTSSRHLQDLFNTFWRCLQDVLQRFLQDVFKTYHQLKLFLLTLFQNDFEIHKKRFSDILQRRLSTEEFA